MASRKPSVLVTGANGEIGHGLITRLADQVEGGIAALDLRELDPKLRSRCALTFAGDLCDRALLDRIDRDCEITTIFHLAALLSTRGERDPLLAHRVNVDATLDLLQLAVRHAERSGRPVRFLFPSSIAVYGIPDPKTRATAAPVTEDRFTEPQTMYGCNKLACEHLGRYYARHYQRLDRDTTKRLVDFRAIRFPGLISADTVPSGGTSDYAPEMIHAAARGVPYACFVREEMRLPFMAMPDAIDAIVKLVDADPARLSTTVYNIDAFNPSAGEIAAIVRRAFPKADLTFVPDLRREAIVASWPAAVDDALARREWGFAPRYDLRATFEDYLLPAIRRRYSSPV